MTNTVARETSNETGNREGGFPVFGSQNLGTLQVPQTLSKVNAFQKILSLVGLRVDVLTGEVLPGPVEGLPVAVGLALPARGAPGMVEDGAGAPGVPEGWKSLSAGRGDRPEREVEGGLSLPGGLRIGPGGGGAPASLDNRYYLHIGETQKRAVEIVEKARLPHEARKVAGCSTQFEVFKGDCGHSWSRAVHRCQSRLCPICQKARAGKIRARFRELVEGMKWPMMLTLTLKTPAHIDRADFKRLIKSFAELRRRKLWKSEGGFWSVECVPSNGGNHLHLHCLQDSRFMPQKAIARAWQEITGDSFIVDIRRADRAAIFEAAKYCTKTLSREYAETPDLLREYFLASRRVRLVGSFGTFYGKHKGIEGEEKFDADLCPICKKGHAISKVVVDRADMRMNC